MSAKNPVDRVIERAAGDSQFRAEVLQNVAAATAEYQLDDRGRQAVLQQVEMMEAQVERDPLQPTEVDHGQADAAGPKG
jgi:hypothetical protein